MSFRLKLTLYTGLIFALGLASLGYFLISSEIRYLRANSVKEAELIEKTLRRTAQDALIQRDDILLLSYLRFLRQQFKALAACDVTWIEGERSRSHRIGEPGAGKDREERTILVRDAADPGRQVRLDITIDWEVLNQAVEAHVRELWQNLLWIYAGVLLVCVLISDWLARLVTRPLAGLSRAVAEIGRGRLGVRLEWDSKDEFRELIDGFNRMSGRLEEIDEMKRDFASSVTHELRSPLGAIESFLNLLEKRLVGGRASNPAQFREYLGRIKANVRRLSGFIGDLLDVSKIERGKMECQLAPVRSQDVAAEVLQFFEAKSREQGVRCLSRMDPALEPVLADPERLRQVLVNLVANALKFTPKGGQVRIEAERYREGEGRFLEIAVADTGCGIDADDQLRLFQKFQQGAGRDNGQGHRGTGLGLFIVRSIVEAHGGKVRVDSASGKGSRFAFNLRMA